MTKAWLYVLESLALRPYILLLVTFYGGNPGPDGQIAQSHSTDAPNPHTLHVMDVTLCLDNHHPSIRLTLSTC